MGVVLLVSDIALHIDFETRGALDLKEVGLHRYARDPNTSAWCMAWALGDGEPLVWTPDQPFGHFDNGTGFVSMHVAAGKPVYAHNAPFELEIWNQIMVPRYGWPDAQA
jgi:DNA polymerase